MYVSYEFQVTLRFTDLSCNRLLVVTTDYTLVLYLSKGEGSLLEWGKSISYLYSLRTMESRNNGTNVHCSKQWDQVQWKVFLLFWTVGIKNNALH
jgi:hypothetical protein